MTASGKSGGWMSIEIESKKIASTERIRTTTVTRNSIGMKISTTLLAIAGALVFNGGCAASASAKKDPEVAQTPSDHGGGGGSGGGGSSVSTSVDQIVDDGLPLAKDDPPRFAGVVTETLDSGGYTYARLKRDDGRGVWTAIGEQKLTKGDRITIERSVVMHDFHSRTLGHTFERIVFGVVLETSPGVPAAPETDRDVIEL